MYVIDSDDQERLSEAAEEFRRLAQADELKDVVILIFANKQDLPNAKSPMAISEALQLHKLKQHCRKQFATYQLLRATLFYSDFLYLHGNQFSKIRKDN